MLKKQQNKAIIPPYINILYYVTMCEKPEKKCFQKAIENLLKQKKRRFISVSVSAEEEAQTTKVINQHQGRRDHPRMFHTMECRDT